MKNYVVSGGYMRRIPINAIKNEKFPVNSLFFREFRSETGYRKTASTTISFQNRSIFIKHR